MRRVNRSLYNDIRLTTTSAARHRQTGRREAGRALRGREVVVESAWVARADGSAAYVHHDGAERVSARDGVVDVNLAVLLCLR